MGNIQDGVKMGEWEFGVAPRGWLVYEHNGDGCTEGPGSCLYPGYFVCSCGASYAKFIPALELYFGRRIRSLLEDFDEIFGDHGNQ